MVEAKVIQVPGAVKDVALEDGATVNDALSAAGVTVESGYTIKVDGADASGSTSVSNGSRIIIAKGAKGNAA